MKRIVVATMAVLLMTAAAVPAGAASAPAAESNQSAEAYSGAHVSFQTESSAVTDYQVNGDLFAESVAVESQSAYESRLGLAADVSLSAVTSLQGASTSLSAQSKTSATVETGGSAELRAHDNEHGHLVVDAGGESQYVTADLSSDAETEQRGESRVTVRTANGSEGTFLVVGDGNVTVNQEGDVSASLSEDAKLVLRTYSESKSDHDEQVERYVANGTATAEAHLFERGGEFANSTVTYGQDTTVEASQSAENEVTVTVDRAQSEGKVLATTVTEEAVGSVEDLNVTVDGEAAVQVDSYSELEGAIGNEPRYMVVTDTSASADAAVLVGIDHFSERTVTMSGDDGGSDGSSTNGSSSDGESSDGGDSSDGSPGFGVLAGLVALLSAAGLSRRR